MNDVRKPEDSAAQTAATAIRLPPIGFWSYSRQDDELSKARLSNLRSLLMGEIQQQYGRDRVQLFQDVSAIPHGAEWEREIRTSLGNSTFFIPIVTPNFLQSEWCCREVMIFFEREEQLFETYPDLPRRRRIFPLQLIDIAGIEPADGRVLEGLRKLQWFDFRELRHSSHDNESVHRALSKFAVSIRDLLQVKVARPPDAEEIARDAAAAAARAREEEAAAIALRLTQEEEERRRRAADEQARQEEAAAIALRLAQEEEQRRREAEEQARQEEAAAVALRLAQEEEQRQREAEEAQAEAEALHAAEGEARAETERQARAARIEADRAAEAQPSANAEADRVEWDAGEDFATAPGEGGLMERWRNVPAAHRIAFGATLAMVLMIGIVVLLASGRRDGTNPAFEMSSSEPPVAMDDAGAPTPSAPLATEWAPASTPPPEPTPLPRLELAPLPWSPEGPPVRARLIDGAISSADYPVAALRAESEGTTAVAVSLDRAGIVTGCSIFSSSGNVALDEAACRIVQTRFRFAPARNAQGRPDYDTGSMRISWRLPRG